MPITLTVQTHRAAPPAEPLSAVFDRLGGTIGRSPGNGLVLDDPGKYISRNHAKIEFQDGGYCLLDIGANPSMVNGRPVGNGRQAPLNDGDTVVIGPYLLAVVVTPEPGMAGRGAAGGATMYGAAAPSGQPVLDALAASSLLDCAVAPGADPLNVDWLAPQDAVTRQVTVARPVTRVEVRPQSPAAASPVAPAQQLYPQPSPVTQAPAPSFAIPDDYDPLADLLRPAAPAPPSAPLSAPQAAPLSAQPSVQASMPSALPPDAAPTAGAAAADVLGLPAGLPAAAASLPQADVAIAPVVGDELMPAEPAAPAALNVAPPVARAAEPPPVAPLPTAVQASPHPVGSAHAQVTPVPVAVQAPVSAPEPMAAPAPVPHSAAVPPQVQQPMAPPAPVSQPAATAAAPQSAADAVLLDALLRGLGMTGMKVERPPAEFVELVGAMLRAATAGTMGVLLARTLTKRESRMAVTMIASQANNPLKFFPDPTSALFQMLGKPGKGYMPPVAAFDGAFDDMKAHEMALLAGMRGALEGMQAHFDPAEIERTMALPSVMDKMLQANRKAKLWDRHVESYRQLVQDADEEYQRRFSEQFARAYEEQIARMRKNRTP
ncbi:type VI secretion system-associated FHA domain protein TagH [Duganella sp. LX20W]|uniref:Type VI secretion system-associated FHA domain protein TagH n=1 Tax=Rugamonas brunnea TaxID=2758569 RepID=A0A7W2EUI3_9BURK|nr:type VI secretion system-associated FHA domain protein TagH [Rugamonas brunnea]MBA5638837.1 type VI secretion system-associated FHA domain protein TagH [Rugamonas brunnea]